MGRSIRIAEIEENIASIRDRVREIEWEYEMGVEGVTLDDRRRALDKLRYLQQERLALVLEAMKMEAGE